MSEPPHVLARIQRGVALWGGAAIVTAAALMAAAWRWSPLWFAGNAGLAERLGVAAAGWAVVGLCLAAAVLGVSLRRFGSAIDIGGSAGGNASPPVAVARAILQNTLEQALLASLAYAALAAMLPGDRLALIPALASLFVVGRIAFAWGLPRGAIFRAFGFVLTFAPSLAGLVWAVLLLAD